MRKYLLFLCIISMLIIAGCSSGSDDGAAEGSEKGDTPKESKKVDFPTKPITLIVPYSAGGGTDAVGRSIANAAESHLGQSIGVVNKVGGGGAVGMTEGANAKPDGYTVSMVTVEVTILPHLGLSTVIHEDFEPITQFNFDPSSIVVAADAPYDTIEEFIAYAKEHPGEVRVANGGTGTIGHLSATVLEKETDVVFNHVPFDGSFPAVTAVLGGHAEAASVQPPEAAAQVEAGNLKILAIMGDERLDTLPDVPTFKESGFDFGEMGAWRGVVVPKGTPEEVVAVLSDAFNKAAAEESFKEFMANNGLGIVSKDAEQFKQLMVDSHKRFEELIPTLDLD